MRRLSLIITIALLLVVLQPRLDTTRAVQPKRSQYAAQLRIFQEFVKRQMATDGIPGLSVGFVKDDFIWSEGFGYADIENKTRNKADERAVLAMQGVFERGLMHYELTQQALGKDAQDAAKAFAYFNECLIADATQSAEQQKTDRIADGHHPVSDLAFVKMGSLMAARLKERVGAARLASYHKTGMIPFFADYAAMSKSDPAYPKELRLNESLEKRLARWDQDWKRTWDDSTRRLTASPGADLSVVAAQLRKSFTDTEVFPNLSFKLMEATQQLMFLGDKRNALIAGKLAVDLYPEFSGCYAALGAAQAIFGEKEGTLALLKRSLELNPNGLASATSLNQLAMRLVAAGKIEEAVAVLKAGAELHPQAFIFAASLKRISEKKAQK